MKHNLPWNVTGIPAEAREIVRTAAHREGVTVGEWLTRRILAEQAKPQEAREQQEEERPARQRSSHETEKRRTRDDFAPQPRPEEGDDLYRRIDETLRQLARRLESGERLQREAQHAMSAAASEINAATRDQAEAFQHLTARIDRVERQGDATPLRDAVRGLHQGLSRLSEQIAKNTTESTTQIAALSVSVETLTGKVAAAREESDRLAESFEEKLAALAERVQQTEQRQIASVQEYSLRLSQAEQRFEERLREIGADAGGSNLDETIAKLENGMSASEERMKESLSGYMASIGCALEEITGRLQRAEKREDSSQAVQEALSNLSSRVESAEKTTHEALNDIESNLADTLKRIAAIEAAVPPAASAAPAQPFAVALEGAAEAALPTFAELPVRATDFYTGPLHAPLGGAMPNETAPPANPQPAAAPFAAENYLAQARRAARTAAEQNLDSSARSRPTMRVPAGSLEATRKGGFGRALAAAAAFIVLFGVGYSTVRLQNLRSEAENKNPVPQQVAETPASAPQNDIALSRPSQDKAPAVAAGAAAPQQQTVASVPASQVAAVGAPGTPLSVGQAGTSSVLTSLLAQANSGDMKAAASLGLKYADGEGVAVNESEAARWLTRAASAGEAVAAYRLGTLYERGRGVKLDAKQAMHWYAEAAKQGNRRAMHNLAVGYADGAGGDKNFAEAARWFKAAAELGLTDSQFNIAVLYERGLGVKKSFNEAYKWYAIAAAAGDAESKTRMGALANQLQPAERDTADKAAKAYKPQPINLAANEG